MQENYLRGKQVRLTAIRKDDASAMARWEEDVGFLRLQGTNIAAPRSAAQIATELERIAEESDSVMFAIRKLEGDEIVGTVGFYEIEWANGSAWMGIGIGDRKNWGKGYGAETVRLILRHAFDEMNLHRISLTVIEYNARAIALYERAGFRREGVFREFGLRDGRRYDLLLYGLLRPDWAARRDS